jgi:hypothetical protein
MNLPESLHKTNEPRYAQVKLEYQNKMMELPVPPKQLYAQSCSNDGVTITAWRDIWLNNIRENKKRFGNFRDHSAGQLFKCFEHKPCIIAGSGPSLKDNAKELLNRGNIPLVSCLHNFHFMEDIGAKPEFYVSLDAGDVVLEEVSEGGEKSADAYWEKTKDRTLIAYIGSSPKLFEKWQGKVYLFNAPLPDVDLTRQIDEIERFGCYVSNGGNVLGACLYLARGFFGSCPIAFVGADFCFSYDHKFHAWDSKYDKNLGYVVKLVDVFGNKRLSWQSYANFKGWFEHLSVETPQIFINCSEGGCLGSYPDGNVISIQQMKLARFLFMYRMHEELTDQMTTPEVSEKKILF